MRMIIEIIRDNVFKGHFIRSFQKLMKRTNSFNPKKWFHFINCEQKSGTFVKHGNFAKVTINHTDCIMTPIAVISVRQLKALLETTRVMLHHLVRLDLNYHVWYEPQVLVWIYEHSRQIIWLKYMVLKRTLYSLHNFLPFFLFLSNYYRIL